MYSEEKKRINLGMDMELYERALQKAKEENRSFANFVVHCVASYCESDKTDTNDQIR